ncbi:hypothetical protein QJS04_geneDACA011926 [Acorus gramineus]|uniref:Uncharacterized protein n=1 Tax=Acorus gramineus TaxID=55184 RepID=A0AAV9AGR4_ACOGR|nr:hypothetical protein QJS04_geneDACA011926 [Acorus gramineus]
MSISRPIPAHALCNILHVAKTHSRISSTCWLPATSTRRGSYRFCTIRAMQSSGGDGGEPSQAQPKTNATTNKFQIKLGAPPNIPTWARWVLGSILLLTTPYWKRFIGFEDKLEKTVEKVAEVVEEVAEFTEKVSSEIVKDLPGDGKLKEFALFVEHLSEEVIKDAKIAEEIVHEVDEVKEDVEKAVETMLDQPSKEQIKTSD